MTDSKSDLLLDVRGICKSFPGVRALDGVNLQIHSGEIHAVLGENGAGKSTLMHILAGVFPPDEGTISLEGQPVSFANARAAQDAGVAMVFQERSLAGPLSIAENVFFGRQPTGRLGSINRRRMHQSTADVLAGLGIGLDPDLPVEQLSPAEQQMVELAKALSLKARLLVLDEPTSTLTQTETEALFQVMRRLAQEGVGIIYISHRLAEVFQICDRLTVLRDGEDQGTFDVGSISEEQLISRMVGRAFSYKARLSMRKPVANTPALEVQGLSDGMLLREVSFQAHAGQITAFAGLAGAGRTELALAIFGARPITSGRVLVQGEPVTIKSPREAMRRGIGYLPEDRKEAGLFLEMGVGANVAAAGLERFGCWWLNDHAIEQDSWAASSRLKITNPRVQAVLELSGGNQQKVMLARWLQLRPPIFIVDEPTRGIDIGAKVQIHDLLRELAGDGVAIVLISSELPEVLHLADRIFIMREGCLVGEIDGPGATDESIMRLATPPHQTHAHS